MRCLLVADFTIENLAGLLSNDYRPPVIEGVTAPFDQVTPLLLDPGHPAWHPSPDAAVIWTRPERVSASFARLLQYEEGSLDAVLSDVDRFASQVIGIQNRVRFAFVPTWTLPPYHRGSGVLEMKSSSGHARVLAHMNLRLTDRLANTPNIFVLDASRWMMQAGPRAVSPKLWYMGKIAFGAEVFAAAASDFKAAINGILGRSRKLVVVDLDDTLWGGVIGDIGRDAIRLGGHDPVGEAYVAFQRTLLALTNRGILVGIVSKNQEDIALDAIDHHPEMVLRRDRIAACRINWEDKARNLLELTRELNLGLQSVVFIDDNPVERDRIRSALPEVLVPEWPADPMLFASTLETLDCFDTVAVSAEDKSRIELYAAERMRQDSMKNIGSVDDWLAGLEMQVSVSPLGDANCERVVQLLNKTNQMNLTTRRLTAAELLTWLNNPNRWLWTFRVADRFGDAGLTGIASCELVADTLKIVDFVLSCRVMGRKVEETMLHTLIAHGKEHRAVRVLAFPIPTNKNLPCRDFFARSGWTFDESVGAFTWLTSDNYPLPAAITVVQQPTGP